ncbi:MAG: hypothetical protein NTV32_04130 [Gammaproteobacteria bacterium]|nr:hypothetical protein [Gammaproteobacteria bacterium]
MAVIQEEYKDHDEHLALEFVSDRVARFTRLQKPVKKLLLGVIDYYLDRYFSYEPEALQIVDAIRAQPDEEKMIELYQQFLLFLPLRLRAGIQGRYLFQEPNASEKGLNAERLLEREEPELGEEEMADLDMETIMKELGLNAEQLERLQNVSNLPEADQSAVLAELMVQLAGPDAAAIDVTEMKKDSRER